MATMTRPDEIKAIHKEYKWFYPFTAGIVILIIGFMLGAVWFKGSDDGLVVQCQLARKHVISLKRQAYYNSHNPHKRVIDGNQGAFTVYFS